MKSMIRLSLLFLSALLMFPAVVKLAHVALDHEHYACNDYSESHFHQEFPDCELCEFQQVHLPELALFTYQILAPQNEAVLPVLAYQFLEEHQELSFTLRGPPALPSRA